MSNAFRSLGYVNNEFKGIIDTIQEKITNNRYWISFFCEWLFILLKVLGYQIDYKSKKDYNYFDLLNNEFTKSELENSILFPHDLLNHANKTNYDNVNNDPPLDIIFSASLAIAVNEYTEISIVFKKFSLDVSIYSPLSSSLSEKAIA